MRRAIELAATTALVLGAAIVVLGVIGLGYAFFAPTQPPPSLNEGHGLAFALGLVTALVGVVVALVGLGIRSALRSGDSRLVAHERPADDPVDG